MATDAIQPPLANSQIGAVSGPAATSQGPATQGAPPPPPHAAAPPTSALQVAVANAAATQGGMAGLLANLVSLEESQSLPAAVQAAAAGLLGAQLPLDPPPTAGEVQQAVAQSGLFLEAQLAADGAPVGGDVKAMLFNLVQGLEAETSGATSAPIGPSLAPPYPGAALQGQAPASPTLVPNAALEWVVVLLAKEAKGALSRQVLMQAASLPKSGQAAAAGQTASRGSAAHWLFELLLAAPDGPAVAEFEIDRDGGGREDRPSDPIWRVRFSLDFAPLGPVHARISLSGGRAHVALWAEDADTREFLNGAQGELADDLMGDDLIAEVAVFQGKPNAAPPPAGHFVNRAV
jgi:hypothetical protein